MDIKNFRLKNKKNYQQVNYSSFNNEDSFFNFIAEKLSNGVDILEFKEEKISSKLFLSLARKIRELCSIYEALFFIYDRCDIAFLCEADGVISSSKSIDLQQAKHILGENAMYGYLIEGKCNLDKCVEEKYDFFVSTEKIDNYTVKPFFKINS